MRVVPSGFGDMPFQSTHPRGVRRDNMPGIRITGGFQSTHPRGVRRSSMRARRTSALRFNPRTREGCDILRAAARRPWLVSIHAPARGATAIVMIGVIGMLMFQSTHPRGVRLHQMGSTPGTIRFQSTHPRGVRPQTCDARSCIWDKIFVRIYIFL